MLTWPREGTFTGEGKWEQRLKIKHDVIDSYWLYNFNHDGNMLKAEHIRILQERVYPTLRNHACHLKITGHASKQGNAVYNQQLSASRALMVKEFFLKLGFRESQVPGTQVRAVGEQFANDSSKPDEFFRAVHVFVDTGLKALPIPVPKPELPEPKRPDIIFDWHWWHDTIVGKVPPPGQEPPSQDTPSRRWSIRYLNGHSVSAGASALGVGAGASITHHRILLYNHETGLVHVARFTGTGIEGGPDPLPSVPGIPVLPNASVTTEANGWRTFELEEPASWHDWEGEGEWQSVVLGDTVLKAPGIRRPVKVETGPTIGIPSGGSHRGVINVTPGIAGTNDIPPGR